MLLADDFGVGQLLWTFLWFFLFVIWIMLIFRIFGDIFSDHTLSGWGKALWSIAIILFPFLGIFVYLIARGRSMAERSAATMKAQEEATREYIKQTAGTASSPAEELTKLKALHDSGAISDAEFATLKAKVLA